MARVPPDSNDILVWYLNETSGNYQNTGSVLPSNPQTELAITNTVRSGNGVFGESCLYIPGNENFPSGSSSTRNYAAGAKNFNPNPPYTVSCWVWVRSYPSGNSVNLVSKLFRDNAIINTYTTPFNAIQIQILSGGNWAVNIASTTSALTTFTITEFPIPLFQWCHIGMTHDGTGIRAYLNGCQCNFYVSSTLNNKVNVATQVYTDGVNGFGPWYVGAIPATGSSNKEEANYMIQDVRVANVARSLEYFQGIYKTGVLPFDLVNVTQYYKLRSYDTSCAEPTSVVWIDTAIRLDNVPAGPCSGTYTDPEVLDTWII